MIVQTVVVVVVVVIVAAVVVAVVTLKSKNSCGFLLEFTVFDLGNRFPTSSYSQGLILSSIARRGTELWQKQRKRTQYSFLSCGGRE